MNVDCGLHHTVVEYFVIVDLVNPIGFVVELFPCHQTVVGDTAFVASPFPIGHTVRHFCISQHLMRSIPSHMFGLGEIIHQHLFLGSQFRVTNLYRPLVVQMLAPDSHNGIVVITDDVE